MTFKNLKYIILVLLIISINVIEADTCQSHCCHLDHQDHNPVNTRICIDRAYQFCPNTKIRNPKVKDILTKRGITVFFEKNMFAQGRYSAYASRIYTNYLALNVLKKPFDEHNPPLII